jgi:uncharacterized membrane protein
MTLANLLLVLAGTLTGLIAGLLYAFTVSVIPALRSLPAKEHLTAMQAINIKIINPVFMLSFLGPTLLLPLAAILHRDSMAFPMLLAAAGLHILGVNGVTIMGNVPLNNRLEQTRVASLSEAEAEQTRQAYHGSGSS